MTGCQMRKGDQEEEQEREGKREENRKNMFFPIFSSVIAIWLSFLHVTSWYFRPVSNYGDVRLPEIWEEIREKLKEENKRE